MVATDLPALLHISKDADPIWRRLSWSRAQRRPRLREGSLEQPLTGWRDDHGWLHFQLLRLDALDQPEPAAVASCSSDETGSVWTLHLDRSLTDDDHRSALVERLKESPLKACFPALEFRATNAGAELELHTPFPGFPSFLAGLGLEFTLPDTDIPVRLQNPERRSPHVQLFLWAGPNAAQPAASAAIDLVHGWVRDDPRHEGFLTTLTHPGHRPPCPLRESPGIETLLPSAIPVECLGLGTDIDTLLPLRDRLLQAGAREGAGGLLLCAVGLGHLHPTTLLLHLFRQDIGLAGYAHPDLAPYQLRLREEVLAASSGDSYLAAWTLLEDLQRQGWVIPLPPVA
jgi:hypothetical protein